MRLPDLGRLVSQSGGLWGYLQSTTAERAKHHQNQRNVKSSQHWKYTFGHHQTSLDIRYIAVSWNLGVPKPSISPWKNMKDDNFCIILGSSTLGNAHSNTLKYLVLISSGLGNQQPGGVWPLPHRPEAKGYNPSGLHGIRRVNPLK